MIMLSEAWTKSLLMVIPSFISIKLAAPPSIKREMSEFEYVYFEDYIYDFSSPLDKHKALKEGVLTCLAL